jgi:mono/diheme cytochrome c family protein
MAGVYSEEQARRGDGLYQQYCSLCHGESTASAPRLVGDDFMRTWEASTVGDLFDRIRQSMPENAPGSLTPQQNADIVSYLLGANKFPAGASELPSDSEPLKRIAFRRPTL